MSDELGVSMEECEAILNRLPVWTFNDVDRLARAHIALLAENANLKRDKERLDWLQEHQSELSVGQHNEDDSQIVVSLHSTEKYDEWWGHTLREAIDTAMQGKSAALDSGEGK